MMGSTTLTKPESVAPTDDFGRGGDGSWHGGSGGGGGAWQEFAVPSRTYQLGMWFALVGM